MLGVSWSENYQTVTSCLSIEVCLHSMLIGVGGVTFANACSMSSVAVSRSRTLTRA